MRPWRRRGSEMVNRVETRRSRPCRGFDPPSCHREEILTMSSATLIRNHDAGSRADGTRNSRGRILIVDDEEVIASTLKGFLQGEAYDVATAMDMPKALALIELFEPDVVLCDV